MKTYLRVLILILSFSLASIILLFALQILFDIKDSFAIAISLVALVVSVISSFKNELFGFSLKIISGELILAYPSAESHESLALIFPLSFINQGYGEGIVESLAIKVIHTESKIVKLYSPLLEIDIQKFLQGKRRLHAENIIEEFAAFPLNSKEAVKNILYFHKKKTMTSIRFPRGNPALIDLRFMQKQVQIKKLNEFKSLNAKFHRI